MKKILHLLLSPALCCLVGTVDAAGLGQRSSDLEEVVVTADANSALSARSASEAIRELKRIPGGIGLVRAEDYLVEFTQSIGDALEFTPGVFADTSAQRENRISIRGSGANATFERRGIAVLRDGVPISRASGITEYQEIDPLSIDYIEVYKGSNGLRYGAASLGGAINVVTPTGATSTLGTSIRLEGGSFDTYRASINTKGKSGNVDYYGAVTKLNSDGYREHAEVDSIYSFGNVGLRINDSAETRFYLTALQDNFELAGSLSLEQALNDPERSPLSYIALDQDRNLDIYRLSNKTAITFDTFSVEVGGWIASRKLDHAITPFAGIIDQEEIEVGISTELSGSLDAGVPLAWTLGANYAESENEAKRYSYLNGFGPNAESTKGDLSSDDDQDASNTIVYGEIDFELTDSLNLIASTQYVRSIRKNKNIFNSDAAKDVGGPQDDSGKLRFEEFSGRMGVLYSLSDAVQFYANISEGYEPPGLTDLTSGGAQPFTVLEAQESLTYEIGTRGQQGMVSWDATIYRSEIENEFIDVSRSRVFGPPGTPPVIDTVTDNANGDTLHQGLELGVDLRFNKNIKWRNIFTYNDFSFDGDPEYGDNTIPGIPEAIFASELTYHSGDKWHAGINLRHIANGAYVDFSNSDKAPGYELLGIFGGVLISDSIEVFASMENLADEEYISNVSTVANAVTDGAANQAADLSGVTPGIYTPGEGRAAYIGISIDL